MDTILKYCFLLFVVVLLSSCGSSGSSSVDSVSVPATPNATSPIGTNLTVLASVSPEWPFVDAMARSAPWKPNVCSAHTTVTTDSNGWVTSLGAGQCASTFMFNSMNGNYPAGTYVVLWEGDGSFSMENDTSTALFHTQGATAPQKNGLNRGTFTITTPTNNGASLEITSVAADYLRNFRVIMPGGVCGRSSTDLDYSQYCANSRGGVGSCDSGESCYDFEDVYWDRFTASTSTMNNPRVVFHPKFLERMEKYRGIRHMEWMSINDSTLQNWNDRASLVKQTFADDSADDGSQIKTTRGVPYEVVIALSNVLNADAWINMPVGSTNDFNTQFAILVKNNLNSNLKAYIEHSNEVWNSNFSVTNTYALAQANAASDIPASDIDSIKIAKWVSKRSLEIFALWDTVFTGETNRFIKVLASNTADVAYSTALLDFNNGYLSIDALAVAGYLAGELQTVALESTIKGWADTNNLDAFFNEVNNGGLGLQSVLAEANSGYTNHFTLTNARNIRMIMYEGGQHFRPDTFSASSLTSIQTFFANANSDSRMGTAYASNFSNWRAAGGDEQFHFNNIDLGDNTDFFGLLIYQTQPRADSPKYDAVMNYIEANECWWAGCTITIPIP